MAKHSILNRRSFLGKILSTSTFLSIYASSAAFGKGKLLASPQKVGTLSEKEFFFFSQFLLEDSNISEATSKKIYSSLSNQTKDIYDFYMHLLKSKNKKDVINKNKTFKTLYAVIMKSWYDGVITNGKESTRATYFDAYRFKALAGVIMPAGICAGATNFWSKKPS